MEEYNRTIKKKKEENTNIIEKNYLKKIKNQNKKERKYIFSFRNNN
jgi:hypothetical protein